MIRKNRNRLLLVIFLLTLGFSNIAQTIHVAFNPAMDTIELELSLYQLVPEHKFGSSYKHITDIDLIPLNVDSQIQFQWNINETKVYFHKKQIEFGDLETNKMNIYAGLSLNIIVSREGEFVEFANFASIRDSVVNRYGRYFTVDDTSPADGGFLNVDFRILDHYYKSTIDAHTFINVHFPEVLTYFQLNNRTLDLYEPNKELTDVTFSNFDLLEIEMQRNTMLIQKDRRHSVVECQFSLSEKGCESIFNQLNKRIGYVRGLTTQDLLSFDCDKARIIQEFKYNNRQQIIDYIYEKYTLIIDDEVYYYWTMIKKRKP